MSTPEEIHALLILLMFIFAALMSILIIVLIYGVKGSKKKPVTDFEKRITKLLNDDADIESFLYTKLFQKFPYPLIMINSDGTVYDMNTKFKDRFGYLTHTNSYRFNDIFPNYPLSIPIHCTNTRTFRQAKRTIAHHKEIGKTSSVMLALDTVYAFTSETAKTVKAVGIVQSFEDT